MYFNSVEFINFDHTEFILILLRSSISILRYSFWTKIREQHCWESRCFIWDEICRFHSKGSLSTRWGACSEILQWKQSDEGIRGWKLLLRCCFSARLAECFQPCLSTYAPRDL
jgi:hypothetical protein